MQKQNNEKIKEAWLKILETFLALKNVISETDLNWKEVPECLVLAQTLDNQFDFFEKSYGVPNEVVSKEEFKDRINKRDVEYKKLYKIFDRVTHEEMVKYILAVLKDRVLKYEMYVASLKVDSKGDIVKMLCLRDEIKMLFDELEIWMGKWGEVKKREEWENKNKMWQEVVGYDRIWQEFAKKYKKDLEFLKEEAKNHLIDEESEFKWWYLFEF